MLDYVSDFDIFLKIGLEMGFRKTSLNAKEVFQKPTSASFIDKAGCTQQFESDLSLRSLALSLHSANYFFSTIKEI